MEPTHVIYHDNCYDGFTAAWCFHEVYGDDIEYLPGQHGEPIPDVPAGSKVVMVDVSWPREPLFDFRGRMEELVILDHHKTAQEALDGFPGAIFDMDRSGAGLAFDWLHGRRSTLGGHLLVDHVEDRDLWRFDLEGTKAIHALLSSYERTFKNWNEVDDLLHKDAPAAYAEGRAIRRYQERRYEEVADLFHYVRLPENETWKGEAHIPAANVGLAQFKSGGIHAFLNDQDRFFLAAAYGRGPDGKVYWSLRSNPGIDCSALAKRYGGGGHAQAAGFTTERMPGYGGEIIFSDEETS